MVRDRPNLRRNQFVRRMRHFARDGSGNTLALIAAGIIPLVAMVGSSVDMGRGYLAQSRLQQACDAGVLAARKRLGTQVALGGAVPAKVAETGQRFFNINYRNGAYGSEERDFVMTLQADYTMAGDARVTLPTAIMNVFGFDEIDITVDCAAQINASNTDIMMVLDTTGSMLEINPGDTIDRMTAMRSTIRQFHAQLQGAVSSDTRLRFGFVPYSTNVNVGALLEDDWVVDEWAYQSREREKVGKEQSTRTYSRNWQYVSGTAFEANEIRTYPATENEREKGGGKGKDREGPKRSNKGTSYSCDEVLPDGGYTETWALLSSAEYPFVGPPQGTQKVDQKQRTRNKTNHWVKLEDDTCRVFSQRFIDEVYTFEEVTEPVEREVFKWNYDQHDRDVRDWRAETWGCIEERDTYQITDFENVNLGKALDLDLDRIPDRSDKTKWRPMYEEIIYARAILDSDGSGAFDTKKDKTDKLYTRPYDLNLTSCPSPARKLAPITTDELDEYLNSLEARGQTYHDIGMIWGGRLMSPKGLFASENADLSPAQPTARHLIYLTDGVTAPLELSYSSYGLEPLDERRWAEGSAMSLTQTVEARFAFTCDEVKKRNITIWVVGFGTSLNPVFQKCAGEGRYFEAADSDQLNSAFAKIASSLAELRVVR